MKGKGEAQPAAHPPSFILAATSTAAEKTHDAIALPLCPHHLHQSHPCFTSAKKSTGVACCVPAFTYWETRTMCLRCSRKDDPLYNDSMHVPAFSFTHCVR